MSQKKIIVPVTLVEGSRAAVAVAAKLAQDFKATIVLLHVVPPSFEFDKCGVETQLHQLAMRLRVATPVEYLACAGQPADVIVTQAAKLKADALVMTTHGDRGWLRWAHRQTARQVIHKVNCPVWLVCPGPARETFLLSIHPEGAAALDSHPPQHLKNLLPSPSPLRTFFTV